MDKFLILGAPEFQIPLIKEVKKRGFYAVVLDLNPDAAGIPYADAYYRCSLKDSRKALNIALKEKPAAISVGMCDAAVETAAVIAQALGLPGLSRETARRATDKFLMIEAFRENSLPHPQYHLIKKGEKLPEKLEFPIISKPTDMAGSRCVRLSRNMAELKENIKESSLSGYSGDIILEQFLEGPELSVELLVLGKEPHVLQLTDKITSGPAYFTELGHVQPSSLPERVLNELKELAVGAAKALQLENTFAHAEIIVTPQGPKLVELGARMGGDSIQAQLLQLSTGINAPEIAVSLALGEKINLPDKTLNKAAAICFLPSREGKLEAVEGLQELKGAEGVKYAALLCREGEVLTAPENNSGRLAYAITQAHSQGEALRLCREALKKLKLIIR